MTPEQRARIIDSLASMTWPEWENFLLDESGLCVEYERIDVTMVSEALGEWKVRHGVWTVEQKAELVRLLSGDARGAA